MRIRPWYGPARSTSLLGHDDRIAGWPRRGVAVRTDAEVDDVEALGQVGGVPGGGGVEVDRGDRHQVVRPGDGVELAGVAVGIAVGGDALVDLPDVDDVPRQVGRGQHVEHRRRRRPAGHGERGPAPGAHGGGQAPGDGAGGTPGRIVIDPDRQRSHGRIMPHRPAIVHGGPGSTVTLGGYTAAMTATTGVTTGGGGGAIARSWRDPLGRAGIAARGVLYLILGLLAIQFARGDTSSDQVSQTGRHPDAGRPAVRQVPARRAHAGPGGAVRVAADPDVRRRPGRGRRRQGPRRSTSARR